MDGRYRLPLVVIQPSLRRSLPREPMAPAWGKALLWAALLVTLVGLGGYRLIH